MSDRPDVHLSQPILCELSSQIFSEVPNLVDVILIKTYCYALRHEVPRISLRCSLLTPIRWLP